MSKLSKHIDSLGAALDSPTPTAKVGVKALTNPLEDRLCCMTAENQEIEANAGCQIDARANTPLADRLLIEDGKTLPAITGHVEEELPVIESHPSGELIHLGQLVKAMELTPADPKKLLTQAGQVIKGNRLATAISDLAEAAVHTLRLMYVSGRLYVFSSPIWKELDENGLILALRGQLRDGVQMSETLAALNLSGFKELYTKVITSPQIQRAAEELDFSERLIAFEDGVFDLEREEFRHARPEDWLFTHIHASVHDMDVGDGQFFEQTISEMTGGDAIVRKQILELLGISISNITPKALFLLVGPPHTGKSQIVELCRLLVGSKNCFSVMNLNTFAGRFSSGNLVGKMLCTSPDLPREYIKSDALSMIRQLTGGDMVQAEQKFKNATNFKNRATLLFGSNHRLWVAEPTQEGAFWERVVSIPILHTVPTEKRIRNLAEHLYHKERGYIIRQAMQALIELRNKNFQLTKSPIPQEFDYELGIVGDDNQCQILNFVSERCVLKSDAFTLTNELHASYVTFCRDVGLPPMAISVFGRELAAKVPGIRSDRGTGGTRGFRGICLCTERE